MDKDEDMEILNRTSGIFQGLRQMGRWVLPQNAAYLLDVAMSPVLLLLLLVMIKGFFRSTFETQKERASRSDKEK